MKKIHIIATVLLILMLFTACSGSVNVTGEWTLTVMELDKATNQTEPVEQVWTFGEDGKGSKVTKGLSDGQALSLPFTYTLTEDLLTLTFADEAEPEQQYTVSGNGKTLILTAGAHVIKMDKVVIQ